MNDWWNTLTGIEQIFWGIALIFSVLFVIQFILSLIGLDFDNDADADTEVHTDHTLDADFTILSVRSIIAFFTFFGWGGVLVLNNGGSTLMATIFASISGFGAMFLVGYMMYWFSNLGEEGNVDVMDAIYTTGEVYLTIPSNGKGQGKIHLHLGGSLREMEAMTEGKSLPTGAKVRVIEVLNDNILLVESVEGFLPIGH